MHCSFSYSLLFETIQNIVCFSGIDPKMLKPPRHGSAGYEIFNPPVSSHVVQEMDVKIQSLSKELTELRASCAASAAKIDSLEEKLRLTNEQMQTLTRRESGSGSEQPGSSGVDRETERNRVLVQSLTCKEVCMEWCVLFQSGCLSVYIESIEMILWSRVILDWYIDIAHLTSCSLLVKHSIVSLQF